jgi:hypothetical protein
VGHVGTRHHWPGGGLLCAHSMQVSGDGVYACVCVCALWAWCEGRGTRYLCFSIDSHAGTWHHWTCGGLLPFPLVGLLLCARSKGWPEPYITPYMTV